MKFPSKKYPQQSFEVRHPEFNAKNSVYSFLFRMDKFKSLSKHKVFNDNGKVEKCPIGKFPSVYNEYNKRQPPLSAMRVIQERHKDVIFAVPRYIPINHKSWSDDIVAIDPGIRTYITMYDTNGFYTGCGEGDMKRVFSLCLQLDKLISRAYGPEMKNKHGKKDDVNEKVEEKPTNDYPVRSKIN